MMSIEIYSLEFTSEGEKNSDIFPVLIQEVSSIISMIFNNDLIGIISTNLNTYCSHNPCCKRCWFTSEEQVLNEFSFLLMSNFKGIDDIDVELEICQSLNIADSFDFLDHYDNSPLVKAIQRSKVSGYYDFCNQRKKVRDELVKDVIGYFLSTKLLPVFVKSHADSIIHQRSSLLSIPHNVHKNFYQGKIASIEIIKNPIIKEAKSLSDQWKKKQGPIVSEEEKGKMTNKRSEEMSINFSINSNLLQSVRGQLRKVKDEEKDVRKKEILRSD